jgi:hypothetical protein
MLGWFPSTNTYLSIVPAVTLENDTMWICGSQLWRFYLFQISDGCDFQFLVMHNFCLQLTQALIVSWPHHWIDVTDTAQQAGCSF